MANRNGSPFGTILTDSSEIDFTYDDATPSISAAIVAASIDETKLDTSVNASLDLADSAFQAGDDAADLGSGAATDGYVLTADGAGGAAWEEAPGAASGIQNVVEDTTPQLGGTLESNGQDIHMADVDQIILGTGADYELSYDPAGSAQAHLVGTGGGLRLFDNGDALLFGNNDVTLEAAGDVSLDATGTVVAGTINSSFAYDRVLAHDSTTTPVAIGTTSTNIAQVVVSIPAHWNSYLWRVSGTCHLVDSSGATTGTTIVTSQFTHNAGNLGITQSQELEGQNNHDTHSFAHQAFATGLTAAIGSTRTITWTMSRNAVNATDADQITMFVEAVRTS